MKISYLLCLVLIGLCAPADAVNAPNSSRLSVARLLFHAGGSPVTPAPPAWSETVRRGVAADQVRMYLAGVIDSGEGDEWCTHAAGTPPHEIDARLLDTLRGETAAGSTGNAATAIQDALRTLYPCK